MFYPLGLDNMKVRRVPVVSAGFAILCVLGYLLMLADESIALGLGMVPAGGLAQVGWLTSMFLHSGLWHLLMNLLFFYMAGPCVEDAWGRGLFVVLFVGGDVVGNVGQWLFDPLSTMPTVGASAAVAACIGATCIQFPRRNVRVLYWIWIHAGTFFVPVWVWGGLWFLGQLFELTFADGGTTVAFAAHVGGLAFGVVMALLVRRFRLSDELTTDIATSVSAGWSPSPGTPVATSFDRSGGPAPESPAEPTEAEPAPAVGRPSSVAVPRAAEPLRDASGKPKQVPKAPSARKRPSTAST